MKHQSDKLFKFPLGQLVMTPGVMSNISDASDLLPLIMRHGSGDWGEMSAEDIKSNNKDLVSGGRLMSTYHLPNGTKIWIITEWDRSVTTILLPEEY